VSFTRRFRKSSRERGLWVYSSKRRMMFWSIRQCLQKVTNYHP